MSFYEFLEEQLREGNISTETHNKGSKLYADILSRFPSLEEPPASAGPDGLLFFRWAWKRKHECNAVLSFEYNPKTSMWEAYFYQSVIPELSSELWSFRDDIPEEVLEILSFFSKGN